MVALNSAQYGSGCKYECLSLFMSKSNRMKKVKKKHMLMDFAHADPGPQCFKHITIQMGSTTIGGVEILGELVDDLTRFPC